MKTLIKQIVTYILLFVFLACSWKTNAQCYTRQDARAVKLQQDVGFVVVGTGVVLMFRGLANNYYWGKGAENDFLPAFALIASGAFLQKHEEPLDINVEFNVDINPYYLLDQEIVVMTYVSRLAVLWSFEYFPPEEFYLMSVGLGAVLLQKAKFQLEGGLKFGFNGRGLAGTLYCKEQFKIKRRLSAVLYQRVCSSFRGDYFENRIGILYNLTK